MSRKKVKINPIRGERLKKLCEEQKITQVELSDRIHISQQTISKIIQGKANLTEDTAIAIRKEFPTYSFDYLMGYDPVGFDSPIEFEKEWIRSGGGSHPLNNIYTVEARISLALEKMNEIGWHMAVNLVETLSEQSELQKKTTTTTGGKNNG